MKTSLRMLKPQEVSNCYMVFLSSRLSETVIVFVVRFDFNERTWRDVNVAGEVVPSTRYGHSAVLYQVRRVDCSMVNFI